MRVSIARVDDAFHFEARNERGNVAHMDTSVQSGGHEQGPGPMEMVLMGMGGCSGIDVVMILNKQQQIISRFEMQLDADRAEGQPAVFTRIHAHYVVDGEVTPEKVRRAIDLSLEKYCSVSAMLQKTATITYSFEVNGTRFD